MFLESNNILYNQQFGFRKTTLQPMLLYKQLKGLRNLYTMENMVVLYLLI